MDDIDRIGRRNVVTFSLANRFWGKAQGRFPTFDADKEERLNPYGTGDVRDLGYLKAGISYDIANEQKDSDRLSDIDVKLRANPLSFLGLSLEGTFHPAPWEVSSLQTSLTLSDPRPLPRRYADPDFMSGNNFSVGYAFVRENPNSFYAQDANIDLDAPPNCVLHPADPRCPGNASKKDPAANVSTSALYHATDNILLFGTTSVDAREGRFLGFSVATKFLSFCECWSVTLGVRQTINPDKTSFYFAFNLAGLGNQKSTLRGDRSLDTLQNLFVK
jgi:hypothetical protein